MGSTLHDRPKTSEKQAMLLAQGKAATLDQAFKIFPACGGSERLLPDVCVQMGLATVGELIAHHEEVAEMLGRRDKYNGERSTQWMMRIAANFDSSFVTVHPARA